MKTGLIDASSAILLYKADLFHAVCGLYHLKVAPAVLTEITVASHTGASFFSNAYAAGALSPAEPGPEPEYPSMMALGDGERETLMAYQNGQGDFVIIDDGRGAAACRSNAIPYINALLCPRILNWVGAIDIQTSASLFKRLLQFGRYSSQVVDYAKTCTPDMLSSFLPSGWRYKRKQNPTRCT